MVRPVRELRGFTRLHREPGETKTATFTLGPEALGFQDVDMHFTVEPGTFRMWVAPNSAEGVEGKFGDFGFLTAFSLTPCPLSRGEERARG